MTLRRTQTPAALGMLALLVALVSSLQGTAVAGPPQLAGVDLDEAWSDVTFHQPIQVTFAADGSGTVYVVERSGRIFRMPRFAGEAKPAKKQLFLDLSRNIQGFKNAQGGLLSVAFHPAYRTNRRLFVALTRETSAQDRQRNPENLFMLVIEEYRSDGTRAIPSSAKPLLAIRKKTALHQAGDLAFGPGGKLFIAVGDDAEPHPSGAYHKSQDMLSPLGKVLRIDVDAPPAKGKLYAIPPDNPWPAERKVLPEIFAYGLRNPWRISFDTSGRLWTVEPGTSHKVELPGKTQEWVTQIVRAGNHGWPYFEGRRLLVQPPPTVPVATLIPKTFTYEREGQESTAGIGGRVYRGSRIPALRGKYVFGDFGRGEVYSIDLAGRGSNIRGANWRLVTEMPNLAAIGEDQDGELYLCSAEDEGWIAVLIPGG